MGMYFYGVNKPGELDDNDPGGVDCQCDKCGELVFLDYEDFKEFHDNYIILHNEKLIECPQCKTPVDRIVTRRPEHFDLLPTNQYVPKCPICHSPNIHKITTGTKVARAAIFGIFALPKAGKQFHCDNCGSEF